MSSAQRLILPGLGRRPLWYVRDWLLLEQLLRHPTTDHTLTDAVRTLETLAWPPATAALCCCSSDLWIVSLGGKDRR